MSSGTTASRAAQSSSPITATAACFARSGPLLARPFNVSENAARRSWNGITVPDPEEPRGSGTLASAAQRQYPRRVANRESWEHVERWVLTSVAILVFLASTAALFVGAIATLFSFSPATDGGDAQVLIRMGPRYLLGGVAGVVLTGWIWRRARSRKKGR